MILAIDVQYLYNSAFVAGIMFHSWSSEAPLEEYTSFIEYVEEYESGSFYKRELPCILALIKEHSLQADIIVIDGYVYLDGKQKPGLGKYLYDSLQGKAEIIGVAKKSFSGIEETHALIRGKSKKPLYITTTGKFETAISNISQMYGENRIPTLLKRADQLCREEANKTLK